MRLLLLLCALLLLAYDADAAADKETREVDCVVDCALLGLPVVAAPPLPDGATEADRERLLREDLKALYGH